MKLRVVLGADDSRILKRAYLEVWSNFLGSFGVIVAVVTRFNAQR